ncbi:MAG: hypothetical protein LKK25_04005, partial [Sphaerochaeta sp.]|nr:hypothetical protein [Sphaerochaeta sp.]
DYSVIGTEFCDFLASVLTYRLINAFDAKSLLNDHTYKKLMSVLKRGKKVKGESGEWSLIKMNPSHEKIFTTLGLLDAPPVPPKRKPGRPKKVKI